MIAVVAFILALTASAAQPPAAPNGLEGRYGLIIDVPARMSLSWLGDVDVTYHTIALAEIRDEDGRYIQHHEVCDVAVLEETSVADLEVYWEDAASVRERTYRVELEGDRYQADLGVRHLGLEEGFTGPLPTDPSAPAVVDAERDGHPGVTLHVTTPLGRLQAFLVQRDHAILEGTRRGADYLAGELEVPLLEQEILGTSPHQRHPSMRTVPYRGQSRFAMFRVPDEVSCAELEARWRTWLERARREAA